MAKPQPPLTPDNFYHIYNHANGDDNIFRSDDNYRYFLKLFAAYIPGIADTYAYCLMPNHFHVAVRIKPEEELKKLYQSKSPDSSNPASVLNAGRVLQLNSKQFSNFFNAYAQAFNKQQRRKGSLFNEPFKRVKVTSVEYLLNLIHYIHNNPVHHGFVKKIDEWNYSSYHALLSPKKTLLARKETLELFGGINAYKIFHTREVNKEFLRTVDFD
jgi:putative transposase